MKENVNFLEKEMHMKKKDFWLEADSKLVKERQEVNSRIYRPVCVISVPAQVMEKIILGGTEKHLKDNTVFGHSQHGFMGRKSCLSNLSAFYDNIPG